MCRVTMGHLRVTIGHLRVTIGHIRVTEGHPRVTMGHLRVTMGYYFSFYKHKGKHNFTPKKGKLVYFLFVCIML